MKVLFVSDWDFTLIWKEIAHMLKANNDSFDCHALIIGKIFFTKYKQCFSSSTLLQDLIPEFNSGLATGDWDSVCSSLVDYEAKYGRPYLFSAAMSDRSYINLPRESRARRVLLSYQLIEEYLDKLKPDAIIMSGYASLPQYALSDIAQYRSIPVIYPVWTRVSNYHYPTYNQYEYSSYHLVDDRSAVSDSSIEKAHHFVTSFRDTQYKPVLENLLSTNSSSITFGHLFRFIRYIYRFYISGTYSGDHSKHNPLKKLFFEAQNRFNRLRLLSMNYDSLPYDLHRCFYFPLQLQPEYSTMISGTDCIDQIGLIKHLATSIPLSSALIVKEHPGMLTQRNPDYYSEIRAIPNVFVVHPKTSTFRLIRECMATITINGTAGFEASLLGKPSIVLSNASYMQIESVLSLLNIPRHLWATSIYEYLQQFNSQVICPSLISYIAHCFEYGFPFNYIEPQENPDEVLSEDNLSLIYTLIKRQLDLVESSDTPKVTLDRTSPLYS